LSQFNTAKYCQLFGETGAILGSNLNGHDGHNGRNGQTKMNQASQCLINRQVRTDLLLVTTYP